jgi:hypothetical protein
VAALLDSDAAGDQAVQQDVLVHTLGNKNILRTKDSFRGEVPNPEVEDLLRETLLKIVAKEFSCDLTEKASRQSKRAIVELFTAEINGFSKYKLAKAFLRWARDHELSDLSAEEIIQWKSLVGCINRALK